LPEKSPDRPFAVTSLAGLVLIFTGAQILRICAAIGSLEYYNQLPLRVPGFYFIVTGVVWGALAFWLALGLWRGDGWAPRAATWGAVAYAAFVWTDRLLLQAPGPQATNWPFAAVATALLLLAVFAIFRMKRVRAYFGE
jgi:hypothetical protein